MSRAVLTIGTGIKSALEEGVKQIDTAMPAQSVANALQKKGVKADEVAFSGVQLPVNGKVTPDQLQEAVAGRTDSFGVQELTGKEAAYAQYTPSRQGLESPTYRERVYTFSQTNGEAPADMASRYTSAHFPEVQDYLAHTRIYDTKVDGRSARVIAELQSDLHQNARVSGYSPSPATAQKEIDGILKRAGLPPGSEPYKDGELVEGLTPADAAKISELQLAGSTKEGIPESPWSRDWLAKSMEREYLNAVDEGHNQLLIPLTGDGVREMARSEGVQSWYESTVRGTFKKLAKRTNATYDEIVDGDTSYMRLQIPGERRVIQEAKPGAPGRNAVDVSDIVARAREAGEMTPELRAELMQMPLSASDITKLIKINAYSDKAAKKLVKEIGEGAGGKPLPTEFQSVLVGLTGGAKKPQLMTQLVGKGYAPTDAQKILTTMEKLAGGQIPTGKEMKALQSFRKASKDIPEIAKMDPKNKASFSLYASPAATAGVGYQAYQAGVTPEEFEAHLVEQYDYSEADLQEFRSEVDVIGQAVQAGLTVDEAVQGIQQFEVTTDRTQNSPQELSRDELVEMSYDVGAQRGRVGGVQTYEENPRFPRATALDQLTDGTVLTAKQLHAKLWVLYPESTSIAGTDIPALFGSQEALQRQALASQAAEGHIVNALKGFGVEDAQYIEGELYINGQIVESSFWEDLKASGVTEVSAIAGGITGYRMTPGNPYMKAAGAFIGATSAAYIGSQADYVRHAYELQQEMHWKNAFYRGRTAAEINAIGEVVGAGVFKLGKSVGKSTWKGLNNVKDLLINGNTKGAEEALLRATYMSADEATEAVNSLAKVMNIEDMTTQERRIAAGVMSRPEGVGIIKTAASEFDSTVGTSTAKSIRERAQDVLKTTESLTDPQAGKLFQQDLANYVGDVKRQYQAVKIAATESPQAQLIQFNLPNKAISDTLEAVGRDLGVSKDKLVLDPTLNKFMTQAARIRSFSDGRSFGDVIEVRHLLNDMLYNKKIARGKTREVLRGTLATLDDMITTSAKHVVDDPKMWLKQWKQANSDYSQMKQIEKTALFRMMFNRDGSVKAVQPESVVKGLTKYMNALDGSYEAVMVQLPQTARRTYEGATIDHLAKKYSMNAQAVNFPMLAEDLKAINFTTPDARAMKDVVLDFAEVFKNDQQLMSLSSNLDLPTAANGLSTSLVAKAKFELATSAYGRLKQKFSLGSGPNNYALARKTSDLLQDPLNAKSIRKLQEEYFDDQMMQRTIRELAQQTAAENAANKDVTSGLVKIYEGGLLKGTKQIASIPPHRIATLEQVRNIADSESLSVDSKQLDAVLEKYGIKGVQTGHDRIRVLGE